VLTRGIYSHWCWKCSSSERKRRRGKKGAEEKETSMKYKVQVGTGKVRELDVLER
jgi:hypothetical protein